MHTIVHHNKKCGPVLVILYRCIQRSTSEVLIFNEMHTIVHHYNSKYYNPDTNCA